MLGVYNWKNKSFSCDGATVSHSGQNRLFLHGSLYNPDAKSSMKKLASGSFNKTDIERLRGQFSVAIYSPDEAQLTIARDHYGLEPLYFWFNDERVVFGSRIAEILNEIGVTPRINRDVLHEYLLFRYLSGKATFLDGVHELEPGHTMRVDMNGHVKKEKYFEFKYGGYNGDMGYRDSCQEQFDSLFAESFNRQTSDYKNVKTNILSSGGIDSSILVSFASDKLPRGYSTYYVGCDGYEHDRSSDADDLSDVFDAVHSNYFMSGEEYAQSLPETIRLNESPLTHPSSVLRNFLYKNLSGKTEVLLSGEGADSLYCGYYAFDIIKNFYVNNPFHRVTRLLGRYIPLSLASGETRRKLSIIKNGISLPPDEFVTSHCLGVGNNRDEVARMLCFDFSDDYLDDYKKCFVDCGKDDVLDIILYIHQTNYLIEAFGTITKLGEAYGLEHRHPFVDHDLVSAFNKFPWSVKTKFFKRKVMVETLAKSRLPKEFFSKPKEGFGVPLAKWFSDEKGLGRYVNLLSDKRTRERGVFQPAYLDQLLEKIHGRTLRQGAYEHTLWPIVNFEIWAKIFIDKDFGGY